MATLAEIAACAGLAPSTVSLVLRKKGPYSEEAARKVEEAVEKLKHDVQASPVTVRDVAARAGVSAATVSNVINGYPVSKAYRTRVEQAIAELGYRPPVKTVPPARQNAVLLVDDFSNPNMFSGVYSALEEEELEPVLLNCDTCRESDILSRLERREALGVIFCNCYGKDMVGRISERFPVVQCGYYEEIERGDIVATDYEWCAYRMTRELLQAGKHRIVLVTAGARGEAYRSLCERGYLRALLEAGMDTSAKQVLSPPVPVQPETGFGIDYDTHEALLRPLMEQQAEQRPDGFLFVDDHFALLYLQILQRMGFRIPEDVSIGALSVGILQRMCKPCIAGMTQSCVDIGVEVVKQLLSRIADPNLAQRRTLFRGTFQMEDSIACRS